MSDAPLGERLLPETWPLHRIAQELGKSSNVLVDASRRGTFPALVKIGALWYVKADDMRAWFAKQHATSATPAQLERIRQAGRAATARQPKRRPRQPRARNAASSQ